jgi:purine nucleosidase
MNRLIGKGQPVLAKRLPRRAAWLIAVGLMTMRTAVAAEQNLDVAAPVKLIFDTDICGDCDDVLALGMIHALESRGACELLAVTISADNDLAAPFVAAVNNFYGRADVEIGVVGRGGVKAESRFLGLADERDGGQLRYPRDSASRFDRPATDLLRQTLSAEPDGSVVIVQVGFATNLARLLDTMADDFSPLSGEELVRKKVRLLSLMAGAFEPIAGDAHYREYNVVQDIESARTIASRWPTPMVWSGFEVGVALPYPAVSIERDFAYVPHHPVAEAYIRYNPPPHERPTWDLTSTLYAVFEDRGYFDLSPPGTVVIGADGSSRFTPDAAGRHRYLIAPPEKRQRVLEAFVQLCSQPPRKGVPWKSR